MTDPALAAEVQQARADPRRRFGPYLVLAELGKGGMGAVYRAWDERLQRQVALKTILSDEGGADTVERFRREAQLVARLRHPSIVQIFEVGTIEGRHYLAMELVSGSTLSARIKEKKLPLTTGLQAVRDVARAVHHAHEQGVVHRDLKPQNVMLDRSDRAFVLDFGLATLRGARARLTKEGAAIGTPAYMPPEQAGGGSDSDARSDVYSLGATLYQVLTGRPPFEGTSDLNVIAAVVSKEPVPPGELNARAKGDLETICLRCLEKEPERRYASAAALADELDRWLAGEPILARPLGPFARLGRRVRRNKLGTALVLALVAAPVAAGGAVAGSLRREREQLVQKAVTEATTACERFEAARVAPVVSGAESARLDRVLAEGLHAFAAIDAVLGVVGRGSSEEREARRRKADVALALARAAREARQWSVAESALVEADRLVAGSARAEKARLDADRAALERSRLEVVEGAFRAAREQDFASWEELVTSLVRVHDRSTRERLVAKLVSATEDLVRALRDQVASEPEALAELDRWRVAPPLDRIEISPGGPLLKALARAATERRNRLLRELREDLGDASASAEPVIAREAHVREATGRAQVERIGGGALAVARLACEALGRVRDVEALPAIVDHLSVVFDEQHAAHVAVALCTMDDPRAQRAAVGGRMRFTRFGRYWLAVSRAVRRSALTALPDVSSPRDLVARAEIRNFHGDVAGAEKDAHAAIEQAPDYAIGLMARGDFRFALGNTEGAIADFQRAVELTNSYHALVRRGTVYLNVHLVERAAEDAERAIKQAPWFAEGHHLRAAVAFEKGDLDGAIAATTKALDVNSDHVRSLVLRASARHAKQQLDAALGDVARALVLDPDDANAWALSALIRFELRDYSGGIAEASAGIERFPRAPTAWGVRATLELLTGAHALAEEDATRAIALAPEDAHARFIRARARLLQKKREGARADLDEFFKLAPAGHPDRANASKLRDALSR